MAIYKARREVLEETNPANTLISLLASGTRIITLLFRQLILGGSRKIETGKVTSKPHSSALPNTSPRDICLPVYILWAGPFTEEFVMRQKDTQNQMVWVAYACNSGDKKETEGCKAQSHPGLSRNTVSNSSSRTKRNDLSAGAWALCLLWSNPSAHRVSVVSSGEWHHRA